MVGLDDGNDGQYSGVVTLTVTNKDDDAVAVDDDLGDIVSGARKVKVDLLSNDTDADGDVIEITQVGDANMVVLVLWVVKCTIHQVVLKALMSLLTPSQEMILLRQKLM
jgi:hypothetical protein